MDKKITLITATLVFFISAYFSYAYFDPGSISQRNGSAKTIDYEVPDDPDEQVFSGAADQECPLNGEMLTKGHKILWEKRRPLGVMIENHADSRPQSGLSKADVIYEAVAEGGITRFLAIYYCKDSSIIGPVRSARIYFIELLRGYGEYPLYAHVGGANTPGPADALGEISNLGWVSYNDLNQFSVGFPVYWRDYNRNPGVATEHTMYSSTKKLWDLASKTRKLTNIDEEGREWSDEFTTWIFKDKKPIDAEASSVEFDFWQGKSTYRVRWEYDKATNKYSRFHGDGKAHIDKKINKQLTASNIVIAFINESSANDGYPGGHLLYKTTGQGKALIFQDGGVIEGKWIRSQKKSQIQFVDLSGKKVPLTRGQIWVEIVPEGNEIEY